MAGGTKRVHDDTTPGLVWLAVADPSIADVGGGTFNFSGAVTATIIKVLQVGDLNGTRSKEFVQFGVKHTASAADYDYTLSVWESDDLPAAGATRNTYVATSCGCCVPVLRIARAAASCSVPMPIIRTKRKFLFFEIVATNTNPAANVTIAPLAYDAMDERT